MKEEDKICPLRSTSTATVICLKKKCMLYIENKYIAGIECGCNRCAIKELALNK